MCSVVALLATALPAFGYSFIGSTWPFGSSINMQLSLGPTSVYLQDGSGTWNNSAAAALDLWNQQLQGVKFSATQTSGTTGYAADGVNTVFFSNTVYGDTWGANTLAVTVGWSDSSNSTVTVETDVIFNRAKYYNSYRGPLQVAPGGKDWSFDLQRVALHEFGHVLGLDHPDQYGQSVTAIMNSVIGDLDHLADDDIAGATALYSFQITSTPLASSLVFGRSFSYYVSTNRSGVTFSAVGLPPGLQINSSTGWITGAPTAQGTFDVVVSATKGVAVASANLKMVVSAPVITSPLRVSVPAGSPFSYKIAATNNPTSFAVSALPAGLQLNTTTGAITGTPSTIGTFPLDLTATGMGTDAHASLTLIVTPPQITSAAYVTLKPGAAAQYQITATTKATSFSATRLPPGLQLDTATGIISGAPTKIGTYDATVKAVTAFGTASAIVHFTVPQPQITSPWFVPGAQVGSAVRYRITCETPVLSYSATGLPAGLQLNTATGLISGIATLSGTYQVKLTVHTTYGDATATLSIVVAAVPLPPPANDAPAATFNFESAYARLVTDPARPRVYAPTPYGLQVVDTSTLTAQSIGLDYTPRDLCMSRDGKTLWILPGSGEFLGRLNLETLAVMPALPIQVSGATHVREGLAHRLYLVDASGEVVQLDGQTGASANRFWPYGSSAPEIEISTDGRSLYVADTFGSSGVGVFDVSTEWPQLLQQTSQYVTNGRIMLLNHSGTHLVLVDYGHLADTNGNIRMVPVTDISHSASPIARPVKGIPTAIAADDASIFFASEDGKIVALSTKTWQPTIALTTGTAPRSVTCDSTGSYLLVGAEKLRAYRIDQPPPEVPAKSLLNVSTRLSTQGGDRRLIGGFIISGTEPKRVGVRALGPSLDTGGALADPTLELYDSAGKLVAQNDNWNSTRQVLIAAGLAARDEHEAAMITTLPPGSYTAIVDGVGQSAGVALVELYDLAPTSSCLANISTRGFVGTGENVMIGGFIIGGDQPTRVVIRALGPSLTGSAINGALVDTMLELHDGNGALVAKNDDWRSDQQQELVATGVAPPDPRESAIVRSLAPGGYTAIVRGKNTATGIGLVEVYNLDLK